jgi:hypothetical protein
MQYNTLVSIVLVLVLALVSGAKARINIIEELSPYLKENTTSYHYRHQFVNAVPGNNPRFQGESYRTHKYKM